MIAILAETAAKGVSNSGVCQRALARPSLAANFNRIYSHTIDRPMTQAPFAKEVLFLVTPFLALTILGSNPGSESERQYLAVVYIF